MDNPDPSAMISSLTFTKCAVYFSISNDYKLIRAVSINEIFDGIDDSYCHQQLHADEDEDGKVLKLNRIPSKFEIDTQSLGKTGNNNSQSMYEYEDSLVQITKDLTSTDSVSDIIVDIAIINASTLLIAHATEHNAYYTSYTSSLLHIPTKYQYVDPNGICVQHEHVQNKVDRLISDRWYVIDTRHVYQSQLDSSKYYYRHEGKNDELTNYYTHSSGKFADRNSIYGTSWITSSIIIMVNWVCNRTFFIA